MRDLRALAAIIACAVSLLAAPGCLYGGLAAGGAAISDSLGSDGSPAPKPPPPRIEARPALAREDLRGLDGRPNAAVIAIDFFLDGPPGSFGDVIAEWRLDEAGAT